MNETVDQLICPNWTDRDYEIRDIFSFWVGGIAVCCVAVPGLILNLTAICVLSTRVSTKNNFNQLITSLFVFDSIFLLSALIEAFRTNFRLYTRIHVILFPKLLYPIRIVSLTASIFMTVGIAYERYIAIKQPIRHRQAMRSAKFRRINLLKYILSTTACAIIFNIPKFFEVEIQWNASKITNTNNTEKR